MSPLFELFELGIHNHKFWARIVTRQNRKIRVSIEIKVYSVERHCMESAQAVILSDVFKKCTIINRGPVVYNL